VAEDRREERRVERRDGSHPSRLGGVAVADRPPTAVDVQEPGPALDPDEPVVDEVLEARGRAVERDDLVVEVVRRRAVQRGERHGPDGTRQLR
jgi:hypothetical protein